MEEKDSIIPQLQEKIKSQDNDLNLAATYGIQLVEDKKKLTAKIEDLVSQKEILEQKKHSLQLELAVITQTLNTQTNELEFQRNQSDNFQEKLQMRKRENEDLLKKIENLRKENQFLKLVQEDLNVENKSLKDKMNLLMKQFNVSMLNNKELQEELSQVHCELEISTQNENHLLQIVQELEEALRERTEEISCLNAGIKQAKEENEELQAEIEILKFDQVGGNSVFAELDRARVQMSTPQPDKLTETEGRLYKTRKDLLSAKQGIITLLQKVKELEKGINQPVGNERCKEFLRKSTSLMKASKDITL